MTDTEDYIQGLIEQKKRQADVHRGIALRALERYKMHTHAQVLLEDEIMKLSQKLVEKTIKKAG